jgi:ATP-dependent RNA helicase DeaD
MKEVQRYLPKRRVLTGFFSATYPPHVLKLADEFLTDPSMISLSHKQAYVAESEHILCACRPMDKDRALMRVLETENPSSAIIFCNTKANVHYVAAVLQGFGYDADELCADLSQSRREAVLAKIREGRLRYLVATDVASRGIDIPELSHVILYEPPEDRESYIHRAGRTGRAGAAGAVISLVDVMQKLELQRIAQFYKIPLIERPTPDDEVVAQVVGVRLTALLESRLRVRTGLEKERLTRFLPLVQALAEDEEQRQLLALLLDELYQADMHARPPVPQGAHRNTETENNPARKRRPRRRRRAQEREKDA